MGDTKIEWTDYTWNPVTGCSKVSQGCKHCYAERLWPKVSAAEAQREGHDTRRPFTDVRCHPERLDQPIRMARPRLIFVNSMSDLFHEQVRPEFIAEVFAHMAYARQHRFQVLTKRAERMQDLLTDSAFHELFDDACSVAWTEAEEVLGRRGLFDPNARRKDDIRAFEPKLPLENVWLGVSAEDQPTADDRVPLLRATPAALRWISAEPLLGPVNVGKWLELGRWDATGRELPTRGLDWVVSGGESGPDARASHPDWHRSLRDQCAAAGVPFLFKQWGEWAPCADEHTGALHAGWCSPVAYTNLASRQASYAAPGGLSKGPTTLREEGFAFVHRIGKKAAGRELDGRTHNGYPA